MTPHRAPSLLVFCAAVAAATVGPRPASAQIINIMATQLSRNAWLNNQCTDVACIRNLVQNNFALTFVPVGASAEIFQRANAFVGSADLAAFVADCPACKANNRPFLIPPGLLFQLANERGSGSVNGQSVRSGSSGSSDEESDGAGVGIGSGNVSIVGPANGGAAASSSAAVAAGGSAPALVSGQVEVTTNPEPATIALMATGLLGLVPVIRRKRRARGSDR